MLNKRTVFVIGAGASVQYGFPLGQGLVRDIVAATQPGGTYLHAFTEMGFTLEECKLFHSRLRGSDASSIDTFLEGNAEPIIRFGKVAIAHSILRAEWAAKNQGRMIGSPGQDHWLGYLWNVMRAGHKAASFAENPVSFVSFNYDRVLEYYFTTVLANSFNLSEDEAGDLRQRALPILHLHGALTGVEFGAAESPTPETISTSAAGIRVIHDTPSEGDTTFNLAFRYLGEAELVVFLGFSYHPVNMERLRVRAVVQPTCVVKGTGYMMGGFEITAARRAIGGDQMIPSGGTQCLEFLRDYTPLE